MSRWLQAGCQGSLDKLSCVANHWTVTMTVTVVPMLALEQQVSYQQVP